MVKMRNSRLPIIMAVQYINMSELNAYLTTKYGIFFAYTQVLLFSEFTKFICKKTKIISLYMSVLESIYHEFYYLILSDSNLIFVPCSICFCHVSNLLLLQQLSVCLALILKWNIADRNIMLCR